MPVEEFLTLNYLSVHHPDYLRTVLKYLCDRAGEDIDYEEILDESGNDLVLSFANLRARIETSVICATVKVSDSAHYKCKACNSRSIQVVEKLIRSTDESTVMEFTCLICAQKWIV